MSDPVRERCKALVDKLTQDALLRQGDPIQTVRDALPGLLSPLLGPQIKDGAAEAAKVLGGYNVSSARGVDGTAQAALEIGMLMAGEKARHDLRERELLVANSVEMERRREAERKIRGWELIIGTLGEALHDASLGGLVRFLRDLMEFQHEAFGDRQTIEGVISHVDEEVVEIKADPTDRKEWLDLMTLGVSAFRRLGDTPESLAEAWRGRLEVLKGRTYPDWRTADPDKHINHVRCDHDWAIWPETNGRERKCLKCGAVLQIVEHHQTILSDAKPIIREAINHVRDAGPPPEKADLTIEPPFGGFAPVVSAFRGAGEGGPKTWAIKSRTENGSGWWRHQETGMVAEYRTSDAAQKALDDWRTPPPQPTEATYTTAEIEAAFRGYLKSVPANAKKSQRWHDREWDHLRAGFKARRLVRGGGQ